MYQSIWVQTKISISNEKKKTFFFQLHNDFNFIYLSASCDKRLKIWCILILSLSSQSSAKCSCFPTVPDSVLIADGPKPSRPISVYAKTML